jgi:hypothetical protein
MEDLRERIPPGDETVHRPLQLPGAGKDTQPVSGECRPPVPAVVDGNGRRNAVQQDATTGSHQLTVYQAMGMTVENQFGTTPPEHVEQHRSVFQPFAMSDNASMRRMVDEHNPEQTTGSTGNKQIFEHHQLTGVQTSAGQQWIGGRCRG